MAASERLLNEFLRRARDGALRKVLFQVHLWTGIGVGLYIFIVGLTGALLVFRSEMQQWAFPQFFRVAESQPIADIQTVWRRLAAAYPGQSISGIDTPTPTRQTFLTYVLKDDRYVAAFAHPVTGEVLGELPLQSFVSRLQDLHFDLLAGPTGRTLNGVGAICLAVLALTGLVIWWPGTAGWRRALRVDFTRSWRRVNFELHHAVGVWMSGLVLVWGVSGAYFVFSREFRALVNAVSPLTPPPVVASDPSVDGAQPDPAIAALIGKARRASPGAELVRVLLPTTERAPVVVTLTHPGLSRADDDQGVSFYFDRYSGELLERWEPGPRSAGDRFIAALAPLHIGMFGGMPVKVLWALLGLAPSLLFATGSVMWWNRVVRDRWSRLKGRSVAAGLTLVMLASAAPAAAQDAAPTQVSQSGGGAYEASLTRVAGGFAVAWYDTRDDRADIYLAVVDEDGRVRGPERRLISGGAAAYEPDVQPVGSDIAVAWYEKAGNGGLTAKLGVWSRDGRERWSRALSAENRHGRNPVVRAARGRVFAAWLEYAADETPAVWGQWFSAEGRPAAPARRLAPAGPTTWNLNAVIDDRGHAWVAFDAKAGTRNDELFLVHFDGRMPEVTRLTEDDGFDSKYPDVSLNGEQVALTWFDRRYGNEEVHLFVAPIADLKAGVERRARRITENHGESIGAYLAWNGRTVGLAWCDDTPGQHEIYFQRFTEQASPIEQPRRITHTGTSSMIPAVRPWRDGFALVWNEFAPGRLGPHDPDGRSQVMFATVSGSAPR